MKNYVNKQKGAELDNLRLSKNIKNMILKILSFFCLRISSDHVGFVVFLEFKQAETFIVN